jgi:hypothetical protein
MTNEKRWLKGIKSEGRASKGITFYLLRTPLSSNLAFMDPITRRTRKLDGEKQECNIVRSCLIRFNIILTRIMLT